VIYYVSATGTKRNLAVIRSYGFRLMVSARGNLRPCGIRYALDNGAWTSHTRSEPFDARAFERAVDRLGADADFVVCPDVVGDAVATLRSIETWLPVLSALPVVLLAAQDGMVPADLRAYLGPRVGVFVGGSTQYKEGCLREWGEACREFGSWFHVGRVNTRRRIRLCSEAGATSADGSSVTRFAVTGSLLDRAVRQGGFVW